MANKKQTMKQTDIHTTHLSARWGTYPRGTTAFVCTHSLCRSTHTNQHHISTTLISLRYNTSILIFSYLNPLPLPTPYHAAVNRSTHSYTPHLQNKLRSQVLPRRHVLHSIATAQHTITVHTLPSSALPPHNDYI